MFILKSFSLVVIILMLSSCSFFSKKPIQKKKAVSVYKNAQARRSFEKALGYLEVEDYKKGIKELKKLIKKHPSSNYEMLGLYNIAGAYEALGKCGAAANRYRRILKTTRNRFPKIESRALLRLSYTYECLGRDDKVVASLLDVKKKADSLSDEERMAEVPARLAAAYSRLGNERASRKYFDEAREGLKVINSKIRSSFKKKEILSRTLFFMGNMNRHNLEKIGGNSYLTSLKELQIYSLKSVEFNHKTWSPRAAQQIVNSYDRIWRFISGPPQKNLKKKSIFDQTNWEDIRESMALKSLESLRYLKQNRFPDEKEPSVVKKLFIILDDQEKKLITLLGNRSEQNPKTLEALQREGLKRPGRVYNPNPILEENRKKLEFLPMKDVEH